MYRAYHESQQNSSILEISTQSIFAPDWGNLPCTGEKTVNFAPRLRYFNPDRGQTLIEEKKPDRGKETYWLYIGFGKFDSGTQIVTMSSKCGIKLIGTLWENMWNVLKQRITCSTKILSFVVLFSEFPSVTFGIDLFYQEEHAH